MRGVAVHHTLEWQDSVTPRIIPAVERDSWAAEKGCLAAE
jgi:hypothetical protein